MFEIKHYITDDGHDVFAYWRVELGNFGDHKPCREGVWELRINVGPGWLPCLFAQAGQTVVLLLCGGIKRSRDADISKACEYWKDWQHSNIQQEKAR